MGGNIPDLIQQMLQADFYPHKVQEPVELIQTHISFVLLTGRFAYKIKKAVDLGFLDFSTLEKRRHFCQEELRLNRKVSPLLYLKVRPIGISKSGGYRFAARGDEIVEYAVQMQQFPQEALFSHLFESNQLKEKHLLDLADLVAKMHVSASTSPEITRYGAPDSIRNVAAKNYELTEPFVGTLQSPEQFERTKRFTDQFLKKHEEWFIKRQDRGKIRECHGDLHLNNVCIYRKQIQIFDCIEFAPQFQNIDVMYDVAFMVMDLEFRGRRDLANVFLNRYIEQTGDFWGTILLPFYCSLRATVRAKVRSLVLLENSVPKEEKEIARSEAIKYYEFAASHAEKRQGRLILMSGLSGTGKTTLAQKLARDQNAIHIRSDAVRKHLAGIPLSENNAPIYTPELKEKTYDQLLNLGLLLATHNQTVILDATYKRVAERSAVLEKAKLHEIPIEILHCTAPVEILRKRLRKRTGDIADANSDVLEQQRKEWEAFTEAEKPYVRVGSNDFRRTDD